MPKKEAEAKLKRKKYESELRWEAERTRVVLKKETVARLQKLGQYRDTLDDIVSRLTDFFEARKEA